jgi:hypothetical protein
MSSEVSASESNIVRLRPREALLAAVVGFPFVLAFVFFSG